MIGVHSLRSTTVDHDTVGAIETIGAVEAFETVKAVEAFETVKAVEAIETIGAVGVIETVGAVGVIETVGAVEAVGVGFFLRELEREKILCYNLYLFYSPCLPFLTQTLGSIKTHFN